MGKATQATFRVRKRVPPGDTSLNDGPNPSAATATSRAVLRRGPTRPCAKLSADFGTRSDDEDRARRVVYDLCGGRAEQAIEPRVPM